MDAFHPAAGKRHGYFPLPARDDREVTAEVVTTNYFRRSLFMKPALLVIDVQKEFFKADAQTIQSLNTAIEYINAAIALFRAKNLPIFSVLPLLKQLCHIAVHMLESYSRTIFWKFSWFLN